MDARHWVEQFTEELWNIVAMIVILGLLAVLLSLAGIYAVVSFAVARRAKDLAIRAALGAGRLEIALEVFASRGRPVVKGLLTGLWISTAVTAALRQMFQGSPVRLDVANPLLYGGVAALLAAAAILAMAGPARRGAATDPLDALRCD